MMANMDNISEYMKIYETMNAPKEGQKQTDILKNFLTPEQQKMFEAYENMLNFQEVLMSNNFADLDKKKAALLENFSTMAKGKSTDELLPLILAFSKKAKSEGITFSKEETALLFENMKKNMTPEEQQKADMLLKMASIL